MKLSLPSALVCWALLTSTAVCFAQSRPEKSDFDWGLLSGEWAESAQHACGCKPDNLHFRFALSADKKTVTFKLDRLWNIASKQVTEYSAEILEANGRMLVIRYGPELEVASPEMRLWELLFIGPGTYRWRATTWREGIYNDVIGVKCLN
jgi:hypothetical protein